MIFTNRFDVLSVQYAIDETALDTFEYAIDGWNSQVHLSSREKIPEYRYMVANNMLFAITDYQQTETGTEITAVDFIQKRAENLTIGKGTYTLIQLISKVQDDVLSNLHGQANPTVEVTDDVDIRTAIDDCVAGFAGYVKVDSRINLTNAGNGQNLFVASVEVIGVDWDSYQLADKVYAMEEYGRKIDTNPQYDTSRVILQPITGIESKNALYSWKSKLSAADYEALRFYIDGGDDTDKEPISDDAASNILIKAIGFSRGVFSKAIGSTQIINKSGVNDGIAYTLSDVDFASYNITRTRVLKNILSQYNGFTLDNMAVKPEMRNQFLMGVNGLDLYVPYSYTIDCKEWLISSADFILVNTLREFSDD
ncbi:hypothetical protein [Pseudolactococcus insecticola]|uniref:Uncharacterized protein n=1 Tax=Pseudolactococcus insecticola TaxID=2709158 RepID=A0A6A0B583_9LACT|nr:hypothetical protein [Lactococcus insecticola]GFH39855.1 hypothetical protein Hs20B_02530 [Lactococcus insecticola]